MKEKVLAKKHSRFRIFFFLLLLIFFIAAAILLLQYRKNINNTESLGSYRISADEDAKASVSLLKTLCRENLSVRLKTATADSHLYLRMAATRKAAKELGFSLDGLNECGYLITRRGNGLYLLSPGIEGLTRACYRLVFDLTDQKGRLLLSQDEQDVDSGSSCMTSLCVGTVPLTEYSIICPKDIPADTAYRLSYYLNQSCAVVADILSEADENPGIFLSVDPTLSEKETDVKAIDGNIYLRGRDLEALNLSISRFANRCLGWMFAGSDKERLSDSFFAASIPDNFSTPSDPWIDEREAIITLWNTNFSRGIFLNSSTSLKTDIMSFSDEQLYEYVKMLQYCGYTGIQVTDMCSAWAGAGGYEFVHERIRLLADAAHSLGMNFTLWVWGAEFTGYGWVDNSVTYSREGFQYAYENPEVIRTFEKYYSIYAELADCCDRVIAHFYDPGNLDQSEDIAFFSKMLRDRFLSINPKIHFGISCWVDQFDKRTFVEALGNDITLYEGGHHDNPNEYNAFRSFCQNTGCELGTWAWNTCEMEIDQLAQMNYNPHIIQSVYQTALTYDEIKKPGYWSEMDSNHVLNVFSLYCAASLLTDPTKDPDSLTHEIALAAVGSEYADAFADMLSLIEDARSGQSWDTYFWSNDNYILKSDEYPAEDILSRSNKALSVLQEMIDSKLTSNTLPLPIRLNDVLRLMLPQLEQIRAFASFRLELEEARIKLDAGASGESIEALLTNLSRPISEYNTVTGLWGQIEARAQYELLFDFCLTYGLTMPEDPTFRQTRKNRIYDYFVAYQKGHDTPVYQYPPYFQYGVAYGLETTLQLVNELVEEGLFSVDEATGGIYVTDWEHYKYAFN